MQSSVMVKRKWVPIWLWNVVVRHEWLYRLRWPFIYKLKN